MKHICVVEDDDDLRTLISSSLKFRGLKTTAHSSADQLVREDMSVDLYILDINLPGKTSGIDLCRYLKSYERKRHVPVIIISGDPALPKLAVAASADAIISKPFAIEDLHRKIKRLL
jgi:CheY-like chemotaxis protein